MNYYRKSNKDNFEDDIKNLSNKIDIIYTSLGNNIEETNNLLQLFNSRINNNIPDENIFNDDIKVDANNRFKLFLHVNQNLVIFTNMFFIYLSNLITTK